jgi:hypothetical protein
MSGDNRNEVVDDGSMGDHTSEIVRTAGHVGAMALKQAAKSVLA